MAQVLSQMHRPTDEVQLGGAVLGLEEEGQRSQQGGDEGDPHGDVQELSEGVIVALPVWTRHSFA